MFIKFKGFSANIQHFSGKIKHFLGKIKHFQRKKSTLLNSLTLGGFKLLISSRRSVEGEERKEKLERERGEGERSMG